MTTFLHCVAFCHLVFKFAASCITLDHAVLPSEICRPRSTTYLGCGRTDQSCENNTFKLCYMYRLYSTVSFESQTEYCVAMFTLQLPCNLVASSSESIMPLTFRGSFGGLRTSCCCISALAVTQLLVKHLPESKWCPQQHLDAKA